MKGPDETGSAGREGVVRVRADAKCFGAWLQWQPGLAVPPEFRLAESQAAGGPQPPPPAVVAALAVHATADVTIILRGWDGGGEVLVCAAVAGDLVGVLCRDWSASGLESQVVEIALAPAQATVDELLRWAPDPARGEHAGLQVLAVGADDAMACWCETWLGDAQGWVRLVPDGDPGAPEVITQACSLPDLADALRAVLATRLIRIADAQGSDG